MPRQTKAERAAEAAAEADAAAERRRRHADAQTRYRQRRGANVGGRPGPVPGTGHGDRAAITRHRRAGEPLCDECRVERNRLARVAYKERRRQPSIEFDAVLAAAARGNT